MSRTESKPYKCPCCDGHGVLPVVDLDYPNRAGRGCRACEGKGIVWSPLPDAIGKFLRQWPDHMRGKHVEVPDTSKTGDELIGCFKPLVDLIAQMNRKPE